MSDDRWLPESEPSRKALVVTIDRRPLSERSKLSDRGLVDFRRVCDQMDILDLRTRYDLFPRKFERDEGPVTWNGSKPIAISSFNLRTYATGHDV
jgi:hypothetical protein